MYLRISFHFEDSVELKTIELDISHFNVWFNDQVLSLYDHESAIYDIPFKYIYTFSHVDSDDVGMLFTVFRDLDLAFESIGLKEVKYNI